MAERAVTANNPNGLPCPDDAQFVELWEKAANAEDFKAKLTEAGFYMSYATILSRRKNVDAALEGAGLPLLKDMPRKKRAEKVDTEKVSAIMERIRAVQAKAEEPAETV